MGHAGRSREAQRLFTISGVVADRLARYNGLDRASRSTTRRRCPTRCTRARSATTCSARPGSRRNKRPELIVDALAHVHAPASGRSIAGRGSHRGELAEAAERDDLARPRSSCSGFVPDDDARRRSTPARSAVVYAPLDEDYGYVTLQAFLAGKPVITAADAGGVLEWVEDGVTGFVTDGTPAGHRRRHRPARGRPAAGREDGLEVAAGSRSCPGRPSSSSSSHVTRLRIGIATRAPVGDDLRAALTRLAERADVRAVVDGGRFDTVVRTAEAPGPYGERTAVWVDADTDLAAPAVTAAAVVLAAPDVAREVRSHVTAPVLALGPQEAHASARPVAPFTRSRIRRARGLQDATAVARHVAGQWSWDHQPVDESAAGSAVALASVLVTDDATTAVLGAAWGAARRGPGRSRSRARPSPPEGESVSHPADEEADRLLADPAALARHAQGCHALYAREHSPDRAVLQLEEILGSAGRHRPRDGFAQPLDLLGTPTDSAVRLRASGVLDALRSPS